MSNKQIVIKSSICSTNWWVYLIYKQHSTTMHLHTQAHTYTQKLQTCHYATKPSGSKAETKLYTVSHNQVFHYSVKPQRFWGFLSPRESEDSQHVGIIYLLVNGERCDALPITWQLAAKRRQC